MKCEVVLNGMRRIVELEREAERWRISLDGESVDADAVEVAPHIVSILLNGNSYEVRITPTSAGALTLQTGHQEFTAEVIDPRAWRGRRHGALEAQGRQQILAPMLGKLCACWSKREKKWKRGRVLLVVEAMKMQNEIRSPRAARWNALLAKEGQPVNAGEVLAWID